MAGTGSFTLRIILALFLMVGFYLLAVGIACFLFYIPYAEVAFTGKIHPKIAVLCVIGGAMILWSVLPRWDRFVAPGPRLTESDQPELFQQLKSIAAATNQSMPVEVYAVPEMNAWVTNRGGVMGIGSRRVMGLGVPLMQVLTTQQFRGVLAHEFGHYYSGDTKLGPWIYVTRSAIIRTVVNLAQNGSSILSKPFEWYLKLFLSITQKVSRQQEFTADALAAKVVGPAAMTSALKTVHSSAMAFDAYWENEYAPILSNGYRAPMTSGFHAFFHAPRIQSALEEALNKELASGKSDLYDSHPALKDRIRSIEKVSGPATVEHDPLFIESIRNIDDLEQKMIGHLANGLKAQMPGPIDWGSVAEKVWVPGWEKSLREIGADVKGISLQEAVEKLGSNATVTDFIHPDILPKVAFDDRKHLARSVFQFAFSLALHRDGWKIDAPIGEDIVANKDGRELKPFLLVSDLAEEKMSSAEFMQSCAEAGVDRLVF